MSSLAMPGAATPNGMNAGGDNCYDSAAVSFRFVVPAETAFGPCEIDEVPGFSVADGGTVVSSADPLLHGVKAVRAREDIKQQRVIGNVARHWSDIVDGHVDGHNPGVGHEAERRFHADNAAERRRNAARAAVIGTDCHIDVAGGHQRRTATGRAAGRVAVAVGVMDRPGGIGVAAA